MPTSPSIVQCTNCDALKECYDRVECTILELMRNRHSNMLYNTSLYSPQELLNTLIRYKRVITSRLFNPQYPCGKIDTQDLIKLAITHAYKGPECSLCQPCFPPLPQECCSVSVIDAQTYTETTTSTTSTSTSTSTSSSTTTTTTTIPMPLRLLFTDIGYAEDYVADPYSVSDWNTFFDLPANGTEFTSVEIVGNEVDLYGGFDINLKDYLFSPEFSNEVLVSVIDDASCVSSISEGVFFGSTVLETASFPVVTQIGAWSFTSCSSLSTIYFPVATVVLDAAFMQCTSLVSVSFPLGQSFSRYVLLGCTSLTDVSIPNGIEFDYQVFMQCSGLVSIELPSAEFIGNNQFDQCFSLQSVSLPVCTSLGETVGDDGVFNLISGNNFTLTIPSALMTCNSGDPDGDIQYLQANNTVTIIEV